MSMESQLPIVNKEFFSTHTTDEILQVMNDANGSFLTFDKPYGVTSYSVVHKVRKLLTAFSQDKWVKVGHGGTLDPLATGFLMIGMRAATRGLSDLLTTDKTYEVTLRLGITSPSFDLETPIVITNNDSIPTQEEILTLLKTFEGEQLQFPPIYSAVKQGGKPVYEMARKGKTPEMTAKSITILDLSLLDYTFPHLRLSVSCTKGTYIRTLAHDIGEKLQIGALVSALRRTVSGGLLVDDAVTPDQLQDLYRFVIPEQA